MRLASRLRCSFAVAAAAVQIGRTAAVECHRSLPDDAPADSDLVSSAAALARALALPLA